MDFDTKLECALAVLTEMAKLSSWYTDFEPVIIGYAVTYGGSSDDITAEFPAKRAKNRQEARQRLRERLEYRYNLYSDEELHSLFGDPINSIDDLVDTAKIEPIYANAFGSHDRKAITNPKTRAAIEDFLNNNPAGYKWNVLLMELKPEYGDDRYSLDRGLIKPYLRKLGITIEDHITFIKSSSSGGVLDAHMILHTAGHAVMDLPENKSHHNDLRSSLEDFAAKEARRLKGNDYIRHTDFLSVLCLFLHFNAAKNLLLLQRDNKSLSANKREVLRKRSLIDINELIHEMVSIFIKRDRVKFAPNEYYENPSEESRIEAGMMQDKINKTLRIVLDNCVDQIIFDAA